MTWGAVGLDVSGVGYVAPSGVVLLHPMSFEVGAGEQVAVVGPNGAGKTTLMKLLGGRLTPSQGTVTVGGDALAWMPARDRARRVAVLAQEASASVALSVVDYVALGRIPWRHHLSASAHEQAVSEALARCGLQSKAGRSLGTLSGGEQQRAAIARAIAQRPGLLLLDEATNHLDLRARADMLDIVRDLGVTAVAVLHDLQLVGRFADRVIVLEQGALAADDHPDRAMSPETVRRVFGLESFDTTAPRGGRAVRVFDAPARAPQSA